MLLKICLLGNWKHTRWKERFKLFTTLVPSKSRLTNVVVPTNILITQHAKAGELEAARHLFDEMPLRTVVSWNTLISGYSKWGRYNEALALASLMHHCNVKLNETTFSTVLSVCAHSGSLCHGKQGHSLLSKSGFVNFDLVGSALLHFYSRCCKIEEARLVFDELHDGNELLWTLMLLGYVQCNMMNDALDIFQKMPIRDVVAWTTLISGYAKSENGSERALELFVWMRRYEVLPNEFTFDCVIRTCTRLRVLHLGKVVHGICIKCGFDFDNSIGSALVEFYCDFEAVDDAKRVYKRIGVTCLNVTNSLISGLISSGQIDEAEVVFYELKEKNAISYNIMIKGYAMSGQVEKSKRLFEKMSPKPITSSNTMISVYSRDGELDKAVKIFDETKDERNSVTWNSMMSGYILNNQHEEALKLYVTMRKSSVDYTRSTFSVLFHACSCLGYLQQGQLLHAHLIKTPFESNVYVGTALIDMYSKCGRLNEAERSFTSISSPNVAAWTALINGYAYHGIGSEAISLFKSMLAQGIVPNAATFVAILSACCHAGLVDEGLAFFRSMKGMYRVTPTIEHYTCVVNLLGRSGHLREAEEFIKRMPIETDGLIWGTLLNSCWFWKDMEVGERAAERLLKMEPKSIFAFVILSNIYAVEGRWGQKLKVRNRLQNLELRKDPGCSWIELNKNVYFFSVEDRSHPDAHVIFETVEHITATINSNSRSAAKVFMGAATGRYWLGHDFPIVFYLALGGSLLSYIYSAAPLKLKQNGWIGNFSLGASYISFPWCNIFCFDIL
ncbi:pentatricopeptide repeat-containing protein [Senna tora]|uniref:Pentatricopeptide repeat-containing protein n=1 Tax=Senna tora TaxID=362788 RepID=A0A834XB64_9FABA|nr:pentatricopeptide repeat-containing protein [Senna tora]